MTISLTEDDEDSITSFPSLINDNCENSDEKEEVIVDNDIIFG